MIPVSGDVDMPADNFSAYLGTVLADLEAAYATRRRDTPTGTIIARLDPQADREAWLTVRRTGIGSSDMAAVLGMSRYRSELDVYNDKTGTTPLDDGGASEAARWGNLLEDVVAREWAERRGVTVRRVGTIANVDRRHMICDLDRLVIGCPDHPRCAVEVKTRSAWKADEWADGAVPDDVEAQVMHQLAVTGLDAIHVAALVGGQTLESRLVLPDPDYVADLYVVADAFWTENVAALAPPAISQLELLVGHLSTLAPTKGEVVYLTPDDEQRVRDLTDAIVEGERAAARVAEAKDMLKALVGDRGTDLVLDGKTWWTWRSRKKAKAVDHDALTEALGGRTLDDFKVDAGTTRSLLKGAPVKARLEGDA